MSYIKPKAYYQIAEKMAEAYARIRDALNDGLDVYTDTEIANGDATSTYTHPTVNEGAKANDFLINITKHVVQEPDDDSDEASNIPHDATRDPIGSIASDLGSTFKTLGQSLTETKAKIIAASYFTSALRALNTHVLARTPLPPAISSPPQGGITTLRTINEYYQAYDDDPRAFPDLAGYEMSLFTFTSGGDYFSDATYFSDNFVELSAQIGITIADTWKQSFWS